MQPMKRSGRHLVALGLCALVWGLAGCSNPAVQERSAGRIERIRQTLALVEARESHNPANVQRTLDWAAQREAQNPANLNRRLVGKRLQRDLESWPQRQELHGVWLADLLDGDPVNLQQTLPKLVN